jgi:N-acetylmuramoyl-L-alanine amidase
MPSVLAEIAFLSNPRDEKLLRKPVGQQSLASALFRGIEGYMRGLGSATAQNHGSSK